MSISDRLKSIPKPKRRTEPVWKGPEEDGITYSMLSRFLVCRERFRLLVVEGLRPADKFDSKIEFGQMWHVCEEALAGHTIGLCPTCDGDWTNEKAKKLDEAPPPAACPNCSGNPYEPFSDWKLFLKYYVEKLLRRYPMDRETINHWYEVTKALFPLYVDHWSQHPDVVDRTPLLQEATFDVPYRLPSGRTVRLRGKWDSVDMIGKGRKAGIWLQENKTKSSIDVGKLTRQLSFDLQTMLYLTAMWHSHDMWVAIAKASPTAKISGIRYNVIRRSAHKSVTSMLKKVEEDRGEGRIGEWFSRWSVEVRATDVEKFRHQCLDPILEQLCNWWTHIKNCQDSSDVFGEPFTVGGESPMIHWRHPFGVWNILDEGGSSDLDAYLDTGSIVGLTRVDEMFPELK